MPQVQITQDPVAVFVIVALIGGAALIALLFAGPWTARAPTVPRTEPEASADGSADVGAPPADVGGPPPDVLTPETTYVAPEVRPAQIPWSTGSATSDSAWAARPEDSQQHKG
jgi:hypothetical protein